MTMTAPSRRQLHGCLEDARVQHLQLDVLWMEPAQGGRVDQPPQAAVLHQGWGQGG
jgi:hypothetical protein